MKLLSKIKELFGARHPFTTAVILAGGSGTRLSEDIPKQHILLEGIEIVVRSMLAFEKCELIDEIVVVCREGETDLYEKYKSTYSISKLSRTVCGKDTRQASALAGFEAVSDKCKYVAIHDAARCLVTNADIESTLREAYKHRAASAAIKVVDSVKLADENGFIGESVDRERVYLAATPQVFKHELYMTAAYAAKRDNANVTDDNSLAERLGFKVKLVACSPNNIKITRPEDLIIAQSILSKE